MEKVKSEELINKYSIGKMYLNAIEKKIELNPINQLAMKDIKNTNNPNENQNDMKIKNLISQYEAQLEEIINKKSRIEDKLNTSEKEKEDLKTKFNDEFVLMSSVIYNLGFLYWSMKSDYEDKLKQNKGWLEMERIKQYKTNILKLVKESDRKGMETAIGLDVDSKFKSEDGGELSWEDHNFDHIIAAASVTLLNKLTGEVRNAESTMLTYLKSSISADDFKFDHVEGRAIPKSQVVFTGDSYEADIIVAAYDTKVNPEVYYKMGADTLTQDGIGGATKLEGENGVVKLKLGAGGVGDQKFAGLIKVIGPDGTPKYYGFKDKFTVLKPSATIAADKMNVLYAGINNPISVSGVGAGKISVSFPGCNLSSTGTNTYNVTVPASQIGKTVTASVSSDGKNMGSTTFRVKKVPDPRAVLGANIRGGKRAKAEILANPMIRAVMGEDFVYDLKWNVNSFRVVFVSKNMEEPPMACQGGSLSEQVKAKIQKSSSGTVIYFEDIKVSSEAGSRTLDGISVRIR